MVRVCTREVVYVKIKDFRYESVEIFGEIEEQSSLYKLLSYLECFGFFVILNRKKLKGNFKLSVHNSRCTQSSILLSEI